MSLRILSTVTLFFLFYLSAFPEARAGADLQIGSLPDDVIMAIRLHDNGSGVGRGMTFGVPIEEGQLDQGTQLVVTDEQGTALPSQWNPLASWRTDGSVLHGAMTLLTSESGDNDGIYYVRPGQSGGGDAVSIADILSSGFEASVSVKVGGTTYKLDASELLSDTVSPRLNYLHFSGPLATEIAIGGPLHSDGNTEHASLQAYFYIRAYEKPVSHVYVTVVLENTGAFNTISDVLAESVDVSVGGTSLTGFPKSSITIHADVRYPKRAWWRGDDSLWVQHDLSHVSDTQLMPKYRPIVMESNVLQAYPQESEWNERRILSSSNLESGGSKPEVAPYDSWTAAYMVSGDRRAWNAMRVATDEYSMMVSKFGSGVVHARDETTGYPLDLTKKGVVGRVWFEGGGVDVLNATRGSLAVAQSDLAHWPSIGYLSYLLTAESNEMENVQHSAVQAWLNEGPGGNKGTIPGREVRWLQTRGMAWALREMINGAVVTPDHHPLRDALQTSASYILEEYSAAGQAADPGGAIGLWFVSEWAFPYDDRTGVAPWMNDYLIWAIGSSYERGWRRELDSNGAWAWIAQGVVGRFGTDTATGYCWENASEYKLTTRSSRSEPTFQSWNDIYVANFGGGQECSSPGLSSIGTDRSATDYGAQIAGGLATAASTGIVGAVDAWSIYDRRQFSWSKTFESRPEWAIIPRDYSIRRPEPPVELSTR